MADLSFSLQFINVTFGDNDLTNDSAIRDTPLFDMVDIEEKGGGPAERRVGNPPSPDWVRAKVDLPKSTVIMIAGSRFPHSRQRAL